MPQIDTRLQVALPNQQGREISFDNMPQNFMSAYQNGMNSARQAPLDRLKALQMDQDIKFKASEIQEQLRKRQAILDGDAYMQENAPKFKAIQETGDPIEAGFALDKEAIRNPNLVYSPKYQALRKSIGDSAQMLGEHEKNKLETDIAKARLAAAQAQVLREANPEKFTALGANKNLRDDAVAVLKKAKLSGDQAAIDEAQDSLAFIEGGRNIMDKAQIQILVNTINNAQKVMADSWGSEEDKRAAKAAIDEAMRKLQSGMMAPPSAKPSGAPAFVPGNSSVQRYRWNTNSGGVRPNP